MNHINILTMNEYIIFRLKNYNKSKNSKKS